jgi:hypothetical protein
LSKLTAKINENILFANKAFIFMDNINIEKNDLFLLSNRFLLIWPFDKTSHYYEIISYRKR